MLCSSGVLRAVGARCWGAPPLAAWGDLALVSGGSSSSSSVSRRHRAHAGAGPRHVFTSAALAHQTGVHSHTHRVGTGRRDRHQIVQRTLALSEDFHAQRRQAAPTESQGEIPYDWCAYYINLARRVDRREGLLGLLAESNGPLLRRLQRLDAVDGQALSLEDQNLRDIISEGALQRAVEMRRRGAHTIVHDEGGRLLHFDNHLTPGGVACALSHRRALQAVAEHPTAEWGLILEDDVIAALPRADLVIANIVSELPDDWDALWLGYHESFGGAHHASGETLGAAWRLPRVRIRQLEHPVFGLFAWVVRREAARALLEHAFPIHGQVDHAVSSYLVWERRRCFAVDPRDMVFFSPKSEVAIDSDIQTMLTARALQEEYSSLENYFNQMWGVDAVLENLICQLGLTAGSDFDDFGAQADGMLFWPDPVDVEELGEDPFWPPPAEAMPIPHAEGSRPLVSHTLTKGVIRENNTD